MAKPSDIQLPFSLPDDGVRQSDSIAGALGQWTTTDHVAVAVPDHTRTLNVPDVLRHVLSHLNGEVCIIVGLGLHRRMNDLELGSLLQYNPVQHDPDDCLMVQLPTGEQVGLGREIVEADWSLSIGVAELHQYAGVSGGYKGVVVGCGARDLIADLHRRDSVCASGVCLGQVNGNPFRERIETIGAASNCVAALVYVPMVQRWLFGKPDLVTQVAAAIIRPWYWVDQPVKGVVLRVPKSKSGTLYQASRAATYLALSPHPPVREGGVVVLDASLEEGIGSEIGFVQALQREPPPWTGALSGKEPVGAGAQRIVMLAKMAHKYKLVLRNCAVPEVFTKLGLDASSVPPVVADGWLEVEQPFLRIPQWRTR